MEKHIEYQLSALSEEVASSYSVIAEQGGTVMGNTMAEMADSISTMTRLPPDPQEDGNYLLNESVSGGSVLRSWQPRPPDIECETHVFYYKDLTLDDQNRGSYNLTLSFPLSRIMCLRLYRNGLLMYPACSEESDSEESNSGESEDYQYFVSGRTVSVFYASPDDAQKGDKYLAEIWYLR